MINPNQFTNLILEPALRATDMYSIDAMYLMLRTLLQESKLTHLKQLPNGCAISLAQIEPATYSDCTRYLSRKDNLRTKILNYTERAYLPVCAHNLMGDLNLTVIIARVKYWMIPDPIPNYKNVEAQAEYYKKYYNTYNGAATIEQFMRCAQDSEGWISHDEE